MLILGLGKTAANTACNLQQIEILDPLKYERSLKYDCGAAEVGGWLICRRIGNPHML